MVEVDMSKQFAVRRLDSLLAPSFCGEMLALAGKSDWALLAGTVTWGLAGYGMLYCYYF
jgi:hypothetical protein